MFHLVFHYDRIPWEKVTKQIPRVAATIYREARMPQNLPCFLKKLLFVTSMFFLWKEMKSRMRSTDEEKNETDEETRITYVSFPNQPAVSAVPDIADEHTNVLWPQFGNFRPVFELIDFRSKSGETLSRENDVQPNISSNCANTARIERRGSHANPTECRNAKRTSRRGARRNMRNRN